MANDFLPFGTSGTANVYTNAEYVADTDHTNGNQPGIAKSKLVNKALRQCSIISAVVAQFISDITGTNSVDDGTTATLLADLKLATKGRIGTPIASAATTTIGGDAAGDVIHITGTTTITSLGVSTTGAKRVLIFDGALIITHNATSLIMPGGVNFNTVIGTSIVFICENGALGYWKCIGISTEKYAPLASPALTGNVSINGVNVGVYPYRNRFINGANNVSQINLDAAVTVTAGAALQYVIDQWYAYCTGANVTGQRIAGSLQSKYRYQYTGAASVTKIGHAQRMEAINTYDMNGQSTMVSVDMSNSLLTSVTWTAWYANTADTFGTLAAPTRTQIATGTITVSPTLALKYIPIAIPSAATTGIEIEFSVGAQISGTWVIGNAQFEKVPTGATQGTEYEWLPIEEEERRCMRYYEIIDGFGVGGYQAANNSIISTVGFKVKKRVVPTLSTITVGTNVNATAASANGTSKSGFGFVINAVATGSAYAYGCSATASAQL